MTELCATVTQVRVLDGYCLELTFSDGVRGVVDLANRIVGRGGVFAPLEAPEFFRRVVVHNELGTILWPNGADFCPDLLYRWATGEAVLRPEPETVSSRPSHENG
jgi:hypothetical protein